MNFRFSPRAILSGIFVVIVLLAGGGQPALAADAVLGYRWHAQLGLYYVTVLPPLARDLGVPPRGWLVAAVLEGGAAHRAGVQRGDIVLESAPPDLWRSRSPGSSGTLQLSRQGQPRTVSVTSIEHDPKAPALPPEPPAPAPRTLLVDAGGKGKYLTITGALSAARPGDTVLVQDGLYQEAVVLPSGVTLRGASRDRVGMEAEYPVLAPGTQGAVLEGMSLRGGVYLRAASSVTLRDCHIAVEKGAGITLYRAQKIRVEGCAIHGTSESRGIFLDQAEGEIVRTMLTGHSVAVRAVNGSRLAVSSGFLDGNRFGISVSDSDLTVAKLMATGGGEEETVGIFLENSRGTVKESSVRGFQWGISVHNTRGEMTGNTLTQNQIGIQIKSSPVNVAGNLILDNAQVGVQILPPGGKPSPRTTVAHNAIRGNFWGISLDKGGAEIHHNLIENNWMGILVEEAAPVIRNNTIVLQRGPGVEFAEGSKGELFNNILAFNAFGVRVDVTASVVADHNNVFGNLATREFPLLDGNYVRVDRLPTQRGEKIPIQVFPAYDLKAATDLDLDPQFVRLGNDYRLSASSPLAARRGKNGAGIGAFPPVSPGAR